VVEPAEGVMADAALAEELIAWCRARLAGYKCPRQIHFDMDMPREPTGKLVKKALVARYAGAGGV